jgi:transcription elongation factor S-II
MPPKSKKAHSALVISVTGEIKHTTFAAAGEVTIDSLKGFFKKKAVVEQIGSYNYKAFTLFLFGVLNGEEGQESKHQLPPPHDSQPVYSDIVVIASEDEESFAVPVEFKEADYEQFYSKQFGSYDSDEEGEGEAEVANEDAPAELEVEADVDDGEVIEDDAGEDEDEGEVEAGDEEGETPVEAVKPKTKRKKAAAKPVVLNMIGPANAYPNKPTLSDTDQLQEETSVQPLTANYRKQVYAVLKKLFTSKLTDEQICTLESCIYNGAIHESKQRNIIRVWNYPLFVHMYKMRARKIMSNFDATSYVKNTDLFDLFQQGSIDFKGLAAMNTYEMFPSRWRDQFEKQQIREKKQLEGNRDMATDQFLCTRCHKRQCTYYELQTRSADEPMTIFITCVNCGKKWRQ